MNKLPSNPCILLSIINMKLRDNYSSLSSLCEDIDEDENEICEILEKNGYIYNQEINQFIYKM